MRTYGVVPARRGPHSQLPRLLAFKSSARIARQGPPCWHNTIGTHARANPAMIQARKLLPFVNKCVFHKKCARACVPMVLCQQGGPLTASCRGSWHSKAAPELPSGARLVRTNTIGKHAHVLLAMFKARKLLPSVNKYTLRKQCTRTHVPMVLYGQGGPQRHALVWAPSIQKQRRNFQWGPPRPYNTIGKHVRALLAML